jgi:hypothetical protein
MTEKTKTRVLVLTSVFLVLSLLTNLWFAVDNGDLLRNAEAAEDLIAEYEANYQTTVELAECLDNLEQFELTDKTVVIKALDLQACGSKK